MTVAFPFLSDRALRILDPNLALAHEDTSSSGSDMGDVRLETKLFHVASERNRLLWAGNELFRGVGSKAARLFRERAHYL